MPCRNIQWSTILNIVIADFETYFDSEYTLHNKMTTEAYVRDPRFEVHGCSFMRAGGNRAEWATGAREVAEACADYDIANSALLCHHSHFDGLIFSHHFNVRPKHWLCTLTMARQQLGNHLSVSLDNVRKHYGIPAKRTPYELFKGKRWNELSTEIRMELEAGCCDEVESIWFIFNQLAKDFPSELYPWVDNTIRMFTEPRLIGDIDVLAEVWRNETRHKAALLSQLGVTAKNLGSDEIFAGLLRRLGVEPDLKTTAAGNIKYAFAKTDAMMQELADDEDDDVRALVEARLSVKSTLQQTRSERLGYMAARGPLCVYLTGFGAHTNRDSGGDKLNFQNFTRSANVKTGVDIRKAIKARRGELTAKVDKSQIECRVLNVFAGQWDVVEKFRNKEDPYVGIASQFYQHEVYKAPKGDPRAEEMEMKRGMGKQLELSCGFGAGASTIIATARKGTYGPAVYLTDEEGERAKVLYRTTHQCVEALWRTSGRMIAALGGTNKPVEWGCLEVHTGRIVLPNGAQLRYPGLSYDEDANDAYGGSWRYTTRKGRAKLYGAKLVENIIQALAWVAFQQDICRIGLETGIWPAVREHDAGTWIIPDDGNAAQWLAYLKQEMSRPPWWMPDIPLDADAVLSERYA